MITFRALDHAGTGKALCTKAPLDWALANSQITTVRSDSTVAGGGRRFERRCLFAVSHSLIKAQSSLKYIWNFQRISQQSPMPSIQPNTESILSMLRKRHRTSRKILGYADLTDFECLWSLSLCYSASHVISKLCQNYSDLCRKFWELSKNIPLCHKTS